MTNKKDLQLHFDFYDTLPPKDISLTWGLHKELSTYLLANENLFSLLTDSEVQDKIIYILLSERDRYGKVLQPFEYTDLITVDSMLDSLNKLFDYFEDFFFLQQQKMKQLTARIQQSQSPTISQ